MRELFLYQVERSESVSDFTGRREPVTKERTQGMRSLTSGGLWLVGDMEDGLGEDVPRDVNSCLIPRYASPTPRRATGMFGRGARWLSHKYPSKSLDCCCISSSVVLS